MNNQFPRKRTRGRESGKPRAEAPPIESRGPAPVQQIESEQSLRLSESRFRLLVDQLPFGLQIIDPTGRIVRVNRAWEKLWGVTLDQLPDYNLLNDPQLKERGILACIQRAFQGETVEIPPVSYVPDRGMYEGQERWTRSLIYPVRGEDGVLLEVVLIQEDITDRKKSEQAIRESEQRLRIATQAGKVGLWEWDITTNHVTWTDSLYAIHGLDRNAFSPTLEGFGVLVHPDDRAMVAAHIERAIRDDALYELTFRAVRPNGDVIWLFTNATVLRENGAPVRMLGATADLTDIKRAEAELRANAERLSLALAAGELGDWAWNAATDLVTLSPRAAEIFGIPPQTRLTWAEIQSLFHEDDRERASRAADEALEQQTRCDITARVNRPDGTQVWVAIVGRAQYGADNRATGMLGVVQDVTSRKITELALAAAQEELKKHAAQLERTVAERTAKLRDSVAELEHFSYTITHDMRAPLRAMQAFGEILRDEYGSRLDEMGTDYLRRIIEAAGRMDSLITDSLNYAKAVQTELTLEPTDPGPLIRGIIESYPQFHTPRAEIRVSEQFPMVLANPAGLTQCLSNLLGNAVKFVRPGETPRVHVWAENCGDRVRLWVEDNGVGIPPDQKDRVFEMFQRMSKQHEGTGVGLALVRKVTEKMRGRAGFESEPGRGSRFWLDLKRA